MPGRDEVKRWIVARLLQVCDVPIAAEAVTEHTVLRRDLGITSLMAVSMVLDAEEHFGIYVEDAELAKLVYVGNVVDLVVVKLNAKTWEAAGG